MRFMAQSHTIFTQGPKDQVAPCRHLARKLMAPESTVTRKRIANFEVSDIRLLSRHCLTWPPRASNPSLG